MVQQKGMLLHSWSRALMKEESEKVGLNFSENSEN